ncbi:hypothetical protein [Thermomonospora umbrina]|uniref:Uncharacterized protein n=1 Tax=Thermomonospora umbrina TaxID=111806 RepID=A0A3D9SL10_9ACTN|nr:hypothetical protein [Thermomonospora umbrina]REE96538.1 hypothetical protein DFJ69_1975 [Thermomonospora umbrina]
MASSEPDFSHMSAGPAGSGAGAPLQNSTRYLCAAAYLDDPFARKVIKEFVQEDSRGVVPSFGFDLAQVIGHCLRARRMRLVRDGVLTLVILLGLALDVTAVLSVLLLFGVVTLLFYVAEAMRAGGGVWSSGPVRAVLVGSLVVFGLFVVMQYLTGGSGSSGDLGFGGSGDFGGISGSSGSGKSTFASLLVLVTLVTVPFGYRYLVYGTLRKLGPGSRESAPEAVGERVRANLARVSAAQRGNITLYSRENPFLGSGGIGSRWARAWSIALELDRTARGDATGATGEGGPPVVDPVELHRAVHDRLIAMRDEPPTNERIGGLMVDWHVVARGECVQIDRPVEPTGQGEFYRGGHPLIDRDRAVPYSRASESAIEAIVRHPQADVRCYQRVTVGTQGQAVRGADGRVVAPAQYQDIMLSAFLYLAVEGRMLYAQFVVNVVPPVREDFRIVDDLPAYSTAMLAGRVVREGGLRALAEGVLGPFRLVRSLVGLVAEEVLAGLGRAPTAFIRYDYGARISVREEAAESGFRTFMQTLDADKYINLIERRINESVLDHLQGHDVDVTAYREQAAVVLNSPFIMNGGSISGSQIAVGGAGATIDQRQTRPPT